MLSNIIFRSTAAFGGAPFRLIKCTALSSAASGAAAGGAAGGVPGALVGGALGVASSLLGGLFGKHNTDKTNRMNYQIMQEQNRFNSEEASEKMSYLKELAIKDKEARDKAAAALTEKEEKEKAEKENAEFQSRLLEIFK